MKDMTKKKILLINPSNTISKDSVRRLTTPLGLLYNGAVLEQYTDHEVKIIDSTCEGYYNTKNENNGYITYGLSDSELRKQIECFDPDIVGITSMFSAHQNNVYRCCDIVKSINKNITVLLGGIHPSLFPLEAVQYPNVDYVICGEGEQRILKFLECIKQNKTFDFDGFAYKNNDKAICKPMIERIEDLDELPLPARHLIDMERYIKIGVPFAPFSREERVEQIMTSRGCPFNCVFCSSVKLWGRKFRKRSVGHIMAEIKQLVDRYRIQEIQFSDDNITIDYKRAEELFRQMIPYDLSWCTPNGLMVKTLDKHLIGLMARSGAYQVSLGLESGSQRVLKEIIHKEVPDKKQLKKIIEVFHKHDIQVHGMLIVGFIGETKKEMIQTLNYPYDIGLDSASFFIANPLPGSELYVQCKEKGYLNEQNKHIDFKSTDIIIPETSPDYVLSREELVALVDSKTKEFNDFVKHNKQDQWDVKYKQFLRRHGEESNLILGRVT